MTDIEIVELFERYKELEDEYNTFLQSDECKRIEDSGSWTPSMLTWVMKFREIKKHEKT